MDKWEDMVKKTAQMSEKERGALMAENKRLCICAKCPSYVGTGEKELLFCLTSKSTKIKKEKGCTCRTCPVGSKMGLARDYYCTRGTEAQQRGKK